MRTNFKFEQIILFENLNIYYAMMVHKRQPIENINLIVIIKLLVQNHMR